METGERASEVDGLRTSMGASSSSTHCVKNHGKRKIMIVKVKILCPLPGVYAELQPEVGKIYEASYRPPKVHATYQSMHYAAVCIIEVNGKKICLKQNEYEICEG
jgi:hypothetical protein